jgi:hypothetical protein
MVSGTWERQSVNREQAIDRLSAWAERANHEAQEADTRDDILNWQGQAQVLGSTATYLAGPGANVDDASIWKQTVADRQSALVAWEKEQYGAQAMFHSGRVAGYDVALTILADVMGRLHTENTLRYG